MNDKFGGMGGVVIEWVGGEWVIRGWKEARQSSPPQHLLVVQFLQSCLCTNQLLNPSNFERASILVSSDLDVFERPFRALPQLPLIYQLIRNIFSTRSPLLTYVESNMSNKVNFIKAKIVSKLLTSNEEKARMKRACSTAISALETTLKIVKEAAGHAGPPGLQTGISGLLFVIGVIKVKLS